MKMWTIYDNDDHADDYADGQRTNFDQKSSLESWAQVSLKTHLVNLDRLKQQNHLQVYWSKFKMLNPWFNINARKMADLTNCTQDSYRFSYNAQLPHFEVLLGF